MNNSAIRAMFILKYCRKLRNACPYVWRVLELTNDDVDLFLNDDPKPNCNRCQYCCLLACYNITGGLMPPTPSPYLLSKCRERGTTPNSSTTLTERQYNSLYRDFNYASQIELRNQTASRSERIEKLGAQREAEMLKIIHTFTSDVFTSLVEEYLELFEEMVKDLILLKETGITLEDICSVSEDCHTYRCQRVDCMMNMYNNLASCRPYKIAEFEMLLLDEVINQSERLQNKTKGDSEFQQEIDHNDINRQSQACDCEHVTKHNNPYLAFLTDIKSYSPSSCSANWFGRILHIEKQMFLKSCLILLRDSDYFRYHSQSFSKSDIFDDRTSSTKSRRQDNNDRQLYNMSVTIYNQTIYHVQSAIFEIFKSLKYNESGRRRLLPPTPDKIQFTGIAKVNETKNSVKKSMSGYLKPIDLSVSSEDEVFTHSSNNQSLEHDIPGEEYQTMTSIKYEEEIKHPNDEYQKAQSNYEHNVSRLQHQIMLQHPKLENADDASFLKNKSVRRLTPNDEEIAKAVVMSYQVENTDFSPSGTHQKNKIETKHTTKNLLETADKTVFCRSKESEMSLFNASLFKGKKNHANVICVINNYKADVSHNDVIAFIEKMKLDEGVLHYPHCSENDLLTKIDGPSFYLSVCCAECRQELAPPQKLEAFKPKQKSIHPSKIMSHILRKNHASFYFPVRCGSCGFFLCDPQKTKKRHLFVPFHSTVKGYVCSSRLKSHECETVLSAKKYTGCRSDTITSSDVRINEENSQQRQSHDHCKKSQYQKYIQRSRSVPHLSLQKEYELRDFIESDNKPASKNAALKFEDAVANILNIWTYEMINYEKGANSPQIRSQIMNYRKSISVFIKKDIKEKLYYRQILSVFKRVESYASPILNFNDRVSTQNMLKIIKKSNSCHAKFKYHEASSTMGHPNYKPECNNSTPKSVEHYFVNENGMQHPVLRSNSIKRKSMVRPHSLHSELELKPPTIQHRRRYSFSESAYNGDFRTEINAWKNDLHELQKSVDSPDFRFDSQNCKMMARPLSLHSELKQKTLVASHRRRSSCSVGSERYNYFSTPVIAWKNELLRLQKSAESPTLTSESRKNTPRPLSLHSELYQKPAVTRRRRSYSLTEATSKEDFLALMSVWKNELLQLQKSAQSPHLGSESMNHKNLIRPLSLHSELKQRPPCAQGRRSCSFTESAYSSSEINVWKNEMQDLQQSVDSSYLRFGTKNVNNNKADALRPHQRAVDERTAAIDRPKSESFLNRFSSQINKSKLELLKLQKSFEAQNFRSETTQRKNMIKAVSLHSEPRHAVAPYRPQSESIINKDFSSELIQWKNKLLKLQNSVESPLSKSETMSRKINVRASSLDSRPKQIPDATEHYHRSEVDDTLTELKTWNLKLRKLERDAISPYLRPKPTASKIKVRAVSLNTEPIRSTKLSTNRPKSESVLDDFSTELETWKHELLTLEEDAKNPQPSTLNRSNKATFRSMHSELKYRNEDRIHFESRVDEDVSRMDSKIASIHKTPNANIDVEAPDHKSPVRRYSTTPRQLPAIPTQRNIRRHSHYETTGNFVNLLSSRKTTHLNTNARSPMNVSDTGTYRNETDRFLKPDENVSRSRFFSQ